MFLCSLSSTVPVRRLVMDDKGYCHNDNCDNYVYKEVEMIRSIELFPTF